MTDDTNPPQPDRSGAPETGWPSASPRPAAPDDAPAWAEPPVDEGSDEDEYDAWLDAQEPEAAAGAEVAPSPVADAAGAEVAPEPGSPPSLAPSLAEGARAGEAPAETPAPSPVADAAGAEAAPEPAPQEVESPVVVPDPIEAAATPLAIDVPDEATVGGADESVAEGADAGVAEADTAAAVEAADVPAGGTQLEAEPVLGLAGAEPEAEGEGAGSEEEPAPGVPGYRSATALVAPLVVLAVLLAALTAFLAVWSSRTSGGGAAEHARRDALSSARQASRLLFSYDYRHLDKDFAAGKAVTTGTFAADYQRTTSKIVDDIAPRYKAVVVADVSDAAVISASASRVKVLVYVTQRSTSTLAAGQKLTQSRLTMTLERKGGRWLVSQVRAF